MPRDLTLIDYIVINFERECAATGRAFLARDVAPRIGVSKQRAFSILTEMRAAGILPKKRRTPRRKPDPIRKLKRATKLKCKQRLAPRTPDEVRKNARRRLARALNDLLNVTPYDGDLATEVRHEKVSALVD